MFSVLGLAGILGMFGFGQNILSEYSHSLKFRNCLCSHLAFRLYSLLFSLFFHLPLKMSTKLFIKIMIPLSQFYPQICIVQAILRCAQIPPCYFIAAMVVRFHDYHHFCTALFPRATSQVACLTFGDCREGQRPRCLQRGL